MDVEAFSLDVEPLHALFLYHLLWKWKAVDVDPSFLEENSPALCFSSKIFLKVKDCSSECPFFLCYG